MDDQNQNSEAQSGGDSKSNNFPTLSTRQKVIQPTQDILDTVKAQSEAAAAQASPAPQTFTPANNPVNSPASAPQASNFNQQLPPASPIQPVLSSPPPPISPVANSVVSNDFGPNPQQNINGINPPQAVVTPAISPTPPITPIPPNNDSFPSPANETSDYESNPFLVTTLGLIQVLRYNAASSMLSQLLSWVITLGFIVFILIISAILKSPAIVTILILLAYIILVPLFSGLHFAVAAESIKEQKVSLGKTWQRSISMFLPLLALIIITSLVSVIGLVLLIIPGIIFIARSSLAPIAMFEEDLGPIESLSRSFALTKGHTIEMLGAFFAVSWLGSGLLLAPAIGTAPLVGRYQDLKKLKAVNGPKPKIHWLNYLVFVVVILIIVGFILFIFTLNSFFHDLSATDHNPSSSSSTINFSSSPTQSDTNSTSTKSSLSSSALAPGEQLSLPPARRPIQYVHVCEDSSNITYVTQGSPDCLTGDSFLINFASSDPGTVYDMPCETTSGKLLRYVYISDNESCPEGTVAISSN